MIIFVKSKQEANTPEKAIPGGGPVLREEAGNRAVDAGAPCRVLTSGDECAPVPSCLPCLGGWVPGLLGGHDHDKPRRGLGCRPSTGTGQGQGAGTPGGRVLLWTGEVLLGAGHPAGRPHERAVAAGAQGLNAPLCVFQKNSRRFA